MPLVEFIKPKLTKKQLFVLETLINGGTLYFYENDNSLMFSDIDSNTFYIRHDTIQRLINLRLIGFSNARPALGVESLIPSKIAKKHFKP